MFNERKAAQVATWFLRQQSGRMSHLKLIKLMYISERTSMDVNGCLITGDRFVSMDQGPVPSLSLSYLNGEKMPSKDGWDSWISDKENHEVALQERAKVDALDELSRADTDILTGVWGRFGDMGKWDLVNYLHDPKNCPEWSDPEGSSTAISYKAIFTALGRSTEEATQLAERIEEQRQLNKTLAAL